MAKKKTEEASASEDFNERICNEIVRDYGEGIIMNGQEVVDKKREIIPISPSLDIITSGGIQEGSWVGVTGPEKYGKTVVALQIAANAQKKRNVCLVRRH